MKTKFYVFLTVNVMIDISSEGNCFSLTGIFGSEGLRNTGLSFILVEFTFSLMAPIIC